MFSCQLNQIVLFALGTPIPVVILRSNRGSATAKDGPTSTLRIQIECLGTQDLEALERGFSIEWFRLFVRVQFRVHEGWSKAYRAILDTGSPHCVVSSALIPDITKKPLFKTRLASIVPKEGSFLKAEMTRVQLSLSDEQVISEPVEALTMITEESRVPLIIGLAAFPKSLRLDLNFKDRSGYIEL